jgi:hypothetical protein
MLQPSRRPLFLLLLSLFLGPLLASPLRRSSIDPSTQSTKANNIYLYPNYNNTKTWEHATTTDFIGFLDSNYGIIFINRSSSSYSSSFHPSSFSDIGGLFADNTTGLFGVFYSYDNFVFLSTINPLFSNYSTKNISLPVTTSCNTTKAPAAAFYANSSIYFTFCNLVLSVPWDGTGTNYNDFVNFDKVFIYLCELFITGTSVSLHTLPFEIDHGLSWSAFNPVSGYDFNSYRSDLSTSLLFSTLPHSTSSPSSSLTLLGPLPLSLFKFSF